MSARTVRRWLVPAVLATLSLVLDSATALALGLKSRSQIVEDLYDTQFIDPNEGWAVGVFGAVYHTTDGGQHWQLQPTPSTQHLYGVSFTDVKNGWAVGRSGEVLATSDGGKQWVRQQSNTQKHLFDVTFLDTSQGWAVGDWGVVLHTEDGGATWQDRSIGEDQILYAIDFADHETGWMVGEFGSIRHTTDGGKTWQKQPVGTQKTFFGVTAVSKDKAWAVGIDGLVARTRDGGTTWEIQQGQSEVASFEQLGFMELLKNPGLYDIKIRGNKGYIVGDVGNVLVTEDGGETWQKSQLPAEWRLSWIRGLSVLPSGQGMLVGAAGLTFAVDGTQMRFSQAEAPASAAH
jgi:photosystem II stability/assembly factor-like uncharacterized protein